MKRVIGFFTRLCEAYLPDAFVFSLILTLIVFFSALIMTPTGPLDLVEYWGRDFWSLNGFSMQMVMVLLTGNVLARSPLFLSLLSRLSGSVQTETGALLLLIIFSMTACWINWGMGLIVSGVLAIELARKLKRVNFPLFIATAYSGFLVWHGGLSGSIPLKVAGSDEILRKIYPDLSIPLGETIFSQGNLIILFSLILTLPFLILSFRGGEMKEISLPEPETREEEARTLGLRSWLENRMLLNIIFFGLFTINVFMFFRSESPFDLNRVNFIFFFFALLLHGSPKNFLRAVSESIESCSGIIIQFPLYAGIMGIMQHSGLAEVIADGFAKISSSETLPLFTFFSGGIVNFFVPSGGGQWVVQGPVMLNAAQSLGVDPRKIIIALSWGDAWTNMIQPFWALPLLGMAGIGLKDIMGYCLVILIWSGILIGGLTFLI
jgi:short-chain fatty acids transporter